MSFPAIFNFTQIVAAISIVQITVISFELSSYDAVTSYFCAGIFCSGSTSSTRPAYFYVTLIIASVSIQDNKVISLLGWFSKPISTWSKIYKLASHLTIYCHPGHIACVCEPTLEHLDDAVHNVVCVWISAVPASKCIWEVCSRKRSCCHTGTCTRTFTILKFGPEWSWSGIISYVELETRTTSQNWLIYSNSNSENMMYWWGQ